MLVMSETRHKPRRLLGPLPPPDTLSSRVRVRGRVAAGGLRRRGRGGGGGGLAAGAAVDDRRRRLRRGLWRAGHDPVLLHRGRLLVHVHRDGN